MRVAAQGQWRLRSYLRFPWRPLIDILGSTTYTLDSHTSKVRTPVCGRQREILGSCIHVSSSRWAPSWIRPLWYVANDAQGWPQVVEHVEGWNVSGVEAIGQMFRASDRSRWRAPDS